MPSGVQLVSMWFVIAAWCIKALSAHTVTLNKSQVNRLLYRETDNGGMKTVNPSGHKVMNYYCCKVVDKEESLDQLLRHNLFFLLKSQTAWLDASLQLKGLFVFFLCFTSLQSNLSHSQSIGLLLPKIRTMQFTFCQLARIFPS